MLVALHQEGALHFAELLLQVLALQHLHHEPAFETCPSCTLTAAKS
jgi:hypothetical protein